MVSNTSKVTKRLLVPTLLLAGLPLVEPFFLFQRISSPLLRRSSNALSTNRRLHGIISGGGGGGGGKYSWSGCLGMSSSQRDSSYKGKGKSPGCWWDNGSGSGGGSSSGSGGGSGSGGSSSGGSGSGSGGSSGSSSGGGGGGDGGGNGGGNAEGASENGNGQGAGGGGGDDDDDDGNGNQGNGGNAGNVDNGNGNGNGNGGNNNGGGGNAQQQNADPYEDFSIDNCPSYEMLWLWDVILECSNEDDLSGCTCEFASNLMDNGDLVCSDMEFCPRECPICMTCLQLLGCGVSTANTSPSVISSSSRWYLFAAAGAVVLLGVLYYAVRRKRDLEDAELTAQLLHETEGAEAAAYAAYGGGGEAGGESVWLAPDTEVEQFEPSMRAALASYGGGAAAAPLVAGGAALGDSDSSSASSLSQSMDAGSDDVWLAPVSTIT